MKKIKLFMMCVCAFSPFMGGVLFGDAQDIEETCSVSAEEREFMLLLSEDNRKVFCELSEENRQFAMDLYEESKSVGEDMSADQALGVVTGQPMDSEDL